jgi:hypothetical protein
VFTLLSHTEKNTDEGYLKAVVLIRMFVFERKDVKKDWTKLHMESIYTLYVLLVVTKITKFSILRSGGYIARIQEIKSYTNLVQKD